MAFRKLRIGENIKILKLEKVLYTNVDVIELEPLPIEAKTNGSLIDGFVRIFNGTTQLVEINDNEIDNIENIGKFCVGSDGKIKIIITKAKYEDVESSKKDLNGYIVYYDIQPVEIIEDKFILDAFDRGTDERLYPSKLLSLNDLQNFITVYCRDLSLERGNEPYFVITPAVNLKEIR